MMPKWNGIGRSTKNQIARAYAHIHKSTHLSPKNSTANSSPGSGVVHGQLFRPLAARQDVDGVDAVTVVAVAFAQPGRREEKFGAVDGPGPAR